MHSAQAFEQGLGLLAAGRVAGYRMESGQAREDLAEDVKDIR